MFHKRLQFQKVWAFISVVTFPNLNLESSSIYELNSVNSLDHDSARVDSACLEHMQYSLTFRICTFLHNIRIN